LITSVKNILLLITFLLPFIGFGYVYAQNNTDKLEEYVHSQFDQFNYSCLKMEEHEKLEQNNTIGDEQRKTDCKNVVEHLNPLKKKELIQKYGENKTN
jgi:hypothetical protein